METVMKIRRQILVDGKRVRSVSRETGLARNTIRKNKTASLKIAIPAASGRGITRFFPCGIVRL